MDPDVRLNLMEKGTRFDHYMELKEVFMIGLDVIDKMAPQYLSPSDKQLRVKLAGAVEVIDKRLNKLADYNAKMTTYANLPRIMSEAAREGTTAGQKFRREQKLLTGDINGKHEAVDKKNATQDTQEPPDEPVGV